MKNKLLSAALAAVITLSCCTASVASFSAAQTDDTAGSSQYAQDSIRGAAVLHCFNWSYNEIKKNKRICPRLPRRATLLFRPRPFSSQRTTSRATPR